MNCKQGDPIHDSGHIFYTVWERLGPKGMWLVYFRCDGCKKESRTKTTVRR